MKTEDLGLIPGSTNLKTSEEVKKHFPSQEEIQVWIVSYMANLLEVEPDEVDPRIPFNRYGLDSSAAVGLTGDLEDWLQYEIDPTLLYDYPTIESLVKHLGANLN